MNDFNKSIKNWLLKCPEIKADKLFFNFLSAGAENQSFQIVENTTVSEDICGNEIGRYTFAVIDFRTLSASPVFRTEIDFDRMADCAGITEWLNAQIRAKNYPTAPAGMVIQRMSAPPAPSFAGADRNEGMNLAKYMIQVTIDYERN
ncbi:MAG: hypothetical protein IJU41_03615 [Clostridia bacterium]|nr:hypothetical protein [Clostridia bacterium]